MSERAALVMLCTHFLTSNSSRSKHVKENYSSHWYDSQASVLCRAKWCQLRMSGVIRQLSETNVCLRRAPFAKTPPQLARSVITHPLHKSSPPNLFRGVRIRCIGSCGFYANFWRVLDFGGLGVAWWPLVPKFAGSNPAEAVGFFRAKKSSARLPSEGK